MTHRQAILQGVGLVTLATLAYCAMRELVERAVVPAVVVELEEELRQTARRIRGVE